MTLLDHRAILDGAPGFQEILAAIHRVYPSPPILSSPCTYNKNAKYLIIEAPGGQKLYLLTHVNNKHLTEQKELWNAPRTTISSRKGTETLRLISALVPEFGGAIEVSDHVWEPVWKTEAV